MSYYAVIDSPMAPIFVGGSDAGVHRIDFLDGRRGAEDRIVLLARESGEAPLRDAGAASAVAAQLGEYFAARLERFDLPLAARGSDFQRRVWRALSNVPYGETASYGEIARAVGNPAAARAVGGATGRNPLSIVVPCHRIVGAGGALTGYGGGLERKARLLQIEQFEARSG